MINRKIAISAVSILGAFSILGGATFAFFSDSGTSSGNIFNSGTLVMALSDDNETNQADVTGTWGLASDPGDTFSGDLKIKNTGSTDADHLEFKFNNVVTPAATGSGTVETTPLDRVIEITSLLWDHDGDGTATVDLLAGVVDNNSNTIKDLDDLETQLDDDFDNVAFGGTQGNDHVFRINGRLHPTLTIDQHQGDSVTMDLTVTMNQDLSQ